MFRIQKILLTDYQEIYEPVLVESPFAEVTEDGIGIKQVQLGLTPTRILIGHDVFDQNASCCLKDLSPIDKDPEIECFQLIKVLPLDALRVLFYRKGARAIMNVRIQEMKSVFYEFGGYLLQNLFWNTWRERIATLRQIGINLFHISASSPFSSTDVIPDEEEITVSIHPSPRSQPGSDYESTTYPLPDVENLYRKFAAIHTDNIEKVSSVNLSSDDSHYQLELQNYFRSLSVTNSFSCGCNTSW